MQSTLIHTLTQTHSISCALLVYNSVFLFRNSKTGRKKKQQQQQVWKKRQVNKNKNKNVFHQKVQKQQTNGSEMSDNWTRFSVNKQEKK